MSRHETLHKGKIIGYDHDYRSMDGYLMVRDAATGGINYICCEVASIERGLEMVCGAGSSVLGEEIYYGLDENMVLTGLSPVKGANGELVRAYDEIHIKH